MRRFTVARAFVLLLLGVGIGTTVFLAQHLSPEAIQAQVDQALGQFFLAKFDTKAVILDLETGVEVRGLEVFYDDGTAAAEVERIILAVDRRELLRGTVLIRQVEVKR